MKLNTLKTSAASNGGSIRYRLYKNNNSSSKSAGLIFARSAPIGTISLSGLAEHIESDSKIEKGTVVAVLEALIKQVRELMLAGYNLKLDDFGIFSIGMSSSGAESAAKFSVVKNIKGIKILFRPSGVLREVISMAKLTEMKQYEEPEA